MNEPLPVGEFEWVKPEPGMITIDIDKNLATPDDADCGLRSGLGLGLVDIEYPGNLHDAHSDYPF